MACSSQGVPWGQSVRAGEAAGAQSPGTGQPSRVRGGPGASSGGGREGGSAAGALLCGKPQEPVQL